jgi:outer membrane protein OmpA-like peptidoglycan-associated protein
MTQPHVITAFLAVSLLLGAGGPAVAQEVGLGIVSRTTVPRGEKPTLTLRAQRPVKRVVVSLRRSDGTTFTLKAGPLAPGAERTLTLDQGNGTQQYQGAITVTYADAPDEGEVSMPLSFDATVLAPPVLSVKTEDLDLPGRRLEVAMDRPARRVDFTVYGDSGQVLDRGEASFPLPVEGKVPVVWNQPEGTQVLRIDLVGHDAAGLFSPTLQLFPWSLEIPHEEVLFPSDQATIPPAELPKVKAAVSEVETAVRRYGKVVDVRLFVAGHTDTVGGADHNRELSRARAQAIGHAFRKAGVRLPILYVGLGEEMPRVVTPDEKDEPRNRRAEYILAVEEPALPGTAGWSRLK